MRKHPFLVGFLSLCGLFVIFIAILWFSGQYGLTEKLVLGENDIAVVDIEGVLTKSKPVVDRLLRLKKDESIKAILLRINSPGGGVGPAQEIYAELVEAAQQKKDYCLYGIGCCFGRLLYSLCRA